jgi:anti-sigma regulatory factor (Ser/Thr protein kinase)
VIAWKGKGAVDGYRPHDMPVKEFDPRPEAVGLARTFVGGQVAGSPVADDVILTASELATNAVRHARTPFTVAVSQDGVIRVEVSDLSPVLPSELEVDRPDGSGRGLRMISVVADRWGAEPTPEGKTVWAEFESQP